MVIPAILVISSDIEKASSSLLRYGCTEGVMSPSVAKARPGPALVAFAGSKPDIL